MNACEAGQGQEVLGLYGGLAAAFLTKEAIAVIAPIWAVEDKIARDVATRVYKRVLKGSSPADALRRERASVSEASNVSPDVLAYVFFGHPQLTVRWSIAG